MSIDPIRAKVFYDPAPGEPASRYISPQDAQDAIDVIYEDMQSEILRVETEVGSEVYVDDDPPMFPSGPVIWVDVDDTSWVGGGGPTEPGGDGGSNVLGPDFVSIADHGAIGDGINDDTQAIRDAITEAGPGGTVFFPSSSGDYMVSSPLKPLERQTWVGQCNPRYWTGTPEGLLATGTGGRIRALQGSLFTGSAVINNNTVPSTVSGVTLSHLCIVGNGEDGSVDGIDLGPNGLSDSWVIENCQIIWCSTGISGDQSRLTVRECFISRNGYGIAPHRGLDTNARSVNSTYISNHISFNAHHGMELASCDSVSIIGNRFERAGATPSNLVLNRDQAACGIYITKGVGLSIVGNVTDANAAQGLYFNASASGDITNVTLVGNLFKRDGSGNNTNSTISGVTFKGVNYTTAYGNTVTFGLPDTGGRATPQYGVEIDSCISLSWIGSVSLAGTTSSMGYRQLATLRPNTIVTITDNTQPRLDLPVSISSTPPSNPQEGTAYWNAVSKTLNVWNATANRWEILISQATIDAQYVKLTGSQTITGPDLTIAAAANSTPRLILSSTGPSGSSELGFNRSGNSRWTIRMNNAAETTVPTDGGGSNLEIIAKSNNGQPRSTPLTILRSTGEIVAPNNIVIDHTTLLRGFWVGNGTTYRGLVLRNNVTGQPPGLAVIEDVGGTLGSITVKNPVYDGQVANKTYVDSSPVMRAYRSAHAIPNSVWTKALAPTNFWQAGGMTTSGGEYAGPEGTYLITIKVSVGSAGRVIAATDIGDGNHTGYGGWIFDIRAASAGDVLTGSHLMYTAGPIELWFYTTPAMTLNYTLEAIKLTLSRPV